MPPTKSSKTLNLALKLAILRRGTQRTVSLASDIGEVRLSKIVRGATATRDERRALARVLRAPQRELFPPELSA
jgi:hypothetical protein